MQNQFRIYIMLFFFPRKTKKGITISKQKDKTVNMQEKDAHLQ